jgi:hypothetical protein
MATMKGKSRTEGRALRPFKGLDGFEELIANIKIVHSTSSGEDTMQVGERHVVSSGLLSNSGYRIESVAEANVAANEASRNAKTLQQVVLDESASYGARNQALNELKKLMEQLDISNADTK